MTCIEENGRALPPMGEGIRSDAREEKKSAPVKPNSFTLNKLPDSVELVRSPDRRSNADCDKLSNKLSAD